MKAAVTWTFLIAILLFAVPLVAAQKQSPKYDPAAEITIKGTVEELKTMGTGDLKETHLVVNTDKGLIEVCLCPAKILSELDMNFAKGDKLEITGSKAKEEADGTEVILARQIVRGDATFVLRDKKGGPVWTWRLKN